MSEQSMSYYLGIYRYHVPFPADVVVRALSILARWLPHFFPAELPVARKRSVRLSSPADYDPDLLPAAFKVNPVETWTPIIGGGDAELEVADNQQPWIIPANVLVTFNAALPSFVCLEGLLSDLIEAFQPDEARLTDEETQIADEVRERRLEVDCSRVPAMFTWLTWLNPVLLEAAGPEALARLSTLCNVRPVAGGAIVRLQDEPTRVDDPEWSRRRQAAEDAFGLEALHRRFPRNVD